MGMENTKKRETKSDNTKPNTDIYIYIYIYIYISGGHRLIF